MLNQSDASQQNLGFLIKTIIVGDASVGKSSILKRFTQEDFNPTYNATIGLEFESKDVNIDCENTDGQKITLQIWDTAGQESFRSIVKSFYRNSAAVLLVYDVTIKKSFEKLGDWVNEIKQNSHSDVIIILIGNKMDDETVQCQVTEKEVQQFIQDQGLAYHFFTSAKNDYQITESFQYVATEVYKRFIKDKHELKNGIRSSSRSISIDNNKARELQQQIDQQEQKQPTPTHRLSIKNQNKNLKLNNSINNDSSIKEQLVDKNDNGKKKKCC